MAEGAVSVVQLASQKTATLLVNHGKDGGYLYNENEQIEKLQIGLEWMRCFLQDAKQDAPKNQRIWKSQIRDFAHEAEDIIDRYLVRISLRDKEGARNAVTRCFRDAKELRRIGDDIDAWSCRLAEFISRIRRLNSQVQLDGAEVISVPATTDIHRWPFRTTRRAASSEEIEIVGFAEEVKTLASWLVDLNMKVICICGDSGSGKTTLAKKVCNDEMVRSYFDSIVWISGSQRIGAREALEIIWLNLCGGDYHDQRKRIKRLKDEELQIKIRVELEKNKYLIVFDNAQIEGSWAALRPALPVPRNSGSKLLLPTHHRVDLSQLCHSDFRSIWEMKPFKDDSWQLLWKIASKGGCQLGNMESKWKEKIKSVDELHPLAVIVLGGVLRTKSTSAEWEAVFAVIPEHGGFLVKVLELSYNELPFHLKCCLVRLANLPPGFEIPIDNLYQMWVAEELVTPPVPPDEPISPHELAKDCLNKLVKRCLVQIGRKGKNGEVETCRMHPYTRNYCLKKEKEEYFSSLTSVGREVDKIRTQRSKAASEADKAAAASAQAEAKGKGKGKGADKKTAATQDSKKSGGNPKQNKTSTPTTVGGLSIRRLHHLAIHHYTGRGKSQKEVLGAIQDREHLRSLLIFSSRFKVLPRNSWLKSLHGGSSMMRALHLEETKLKTLPHQIGELSHLRYLSLRGSKVTRALPSSIGKLLMLETLDLRACGSYGLFHGLAMFGSGDSVMVPNVLWKLKSLRRLYLPESYMVTMSRRLKLYSLTQLETLENLDLRSCKVKDLAKLARLRNFTWMIKETNGMFEKSDRKILKGLLACPCLAEAGDQVSTGSGQGSAETPRPGKYTIKMNGEMLSQDYAKKLVEIPGYENSVQGLTIWGPIHPQILDDNIQKTVFNNLTSLVLRLTQLDDDSKLMQILGRLQRLQKLRLSYLSFLGKELECGADEFQELVYLKLDLLPQLQSLVVQAGSMPKLEVLEIEYCDELRQIPDSVKGKRGHVIYSRPPSTSQSAASSSQQEGQS